MKYVVRVIVLAAAAALAGCAANSYCKGEQSYQKAPSVPPLKAADGLKLPESASALKIPPPAVNPVAFGETAKDEDGDEVIRCLDKPLPMAVAAEAPAAPAPVVVPAKVDTPPEVIPAEPVAPKPAARKKKKVAAATAPKG